MTFHVFDRLHLPVRVPLIGSSVRRAVRLRSTESAALIDDRSGGAPNPQPSNYLRLDPGDLLGPEPLYLTSEVLDAVRTTIGAAAAEQGGMLGGLRRRGVASDYYFDGTADRSSVTYTPDTTTINALLKEQWNPNGVDLLGFVHSHPAGNRRPSRGDLEYADRILAAIPAMDRMYMPIVQTTPDTGTFSLHGFVAHRGQHGTEITDVDVRVLTEHVDTTSGSDPAFSRIADAVDLTALAGLRLVVVGVGGAAAFAESMARSGVGEFVLIDPDVVEAPNVGTQQVYRADIGRPKIDAVAERILDVNPHARVVGVQALLNDLTDDMVRRLVNRPLPNSDTPGPLGTILCGFTDSFWAQARVNRLALHLGVPMVAAQVYPAGMGVETSFHVPGRSVACGRCVLGSRYRAFLADPSTAAGVSQGTPLWATERLNALKSEIVLAVAHGIVMGDPDHPGRQRYEALLDRIATRNLVQVRLHPDAPLPAFDKAFAHADHARIVSDETLWLPQLPESSETGFAPCGDCGGTGDLTDAIGTIADSRLRPSPDQEKERDLPQLDRSA